MKERSFRGLLVWRQAMNLARDCYFLTKKLPKEELFGLTRQMRRAAVSVPANIAEGSGRGTRKDFVNFLRISQGSLREMETYLELIVEVGLVSKQNTEELQREVESVAKLLNRLIQSLQPPA
jgi:four helix bundle protein